MDISKLTLIGCSHQNASLQQRESLMLTKEMREVIKIDCEVDEGSEIITLVTCNRIEIYAYGVNKNNVFRSWASLIQINPKELENLCYIKQGLQAIDHWVRVSVGLDSAMIGEPDILGQIKKAHEISSKAFVLKKISQWVIRTAKKIRVGSGVGQHATSFISLSQMLAKRLFTHWSETKVLLIGSGDMIESALNLWSSENSNLILCNRSVVKAKSLAELYGIKAIGLSQIPEALKEVDCVISATASPLPLIGKGMLEKAMKVNNKPRLLIDLAMPRDIEPEVASMQGVYLYHLDDLKLLAKEGESRRQQSVGLASQLIQSSMKEFEKECMLRSFSGEIHSFHEKLSQLADAEYDKCIHHKDKLGDFDIEVLKNFQKKLVHHSTVLMKEFISYDESTKENFERIKELEEL